MLLMLFGCSQQQQMQQNAYTPRYVYRKGYTAYVLRNGRAVAPQKAPARIKRVIAAGNKIINKPYRRGGGHGRHHDTAYDCSGSTAFILREAGMLKPALWLDSLREFAGCETFANRIYRKNILALNKKKKLIPMEEV